MRGFWSRGGKKRKGREERHTDEYAQIPPRKRHSGNDGAGPVDVLACRPREPEESGGDPEGA